MNQIAAPSRVWYVLIEKRKVTDRRMMTADEAMKINQHLSGKRWRLQKFCR